MKRSHDVTDILIEQYTATGRCAWRHPRKKRITVDGRNMPEAEAISKMRWVVASDKKPTP